MVLVVRRMWIVAFQAIADGRKVNASLDFIGIFISMALDAKLYRGYCFEIYAGDIIVCTNLVTTQTAGCNCRMDGLPFLFIFVTLQALAAIDVLVKDNRMFPCHGEREKSGEKRKYKGEFL